MKQNIILVLLAIWTVYLVSHTYAHENFEHITIVGQGKMLRDFSDDEYETHYDQVKGRPFYGWKVHYVNRNVKVTYTSETLFAYYNNGLSAISYQYKSVKKQIDSYSLSVSGGIKLKTNKNTKIFGEGLDASISVTSKWDSKQEETEEINIRVSIEPKTQMVLYMYGEGLITNGVAKNFIFWIEANKGGFEVFNVTTHYQRLEVIPI